MVQRTRKRSPHYPWDTWLSRPVFTVHAGVDFTAPLHTFLQVLRNRAARTGKGLRIEVSEDQTRVTVRVRQGAKRTYYQRELLG